MTPWTARDTFDVLRIGSLKHFLRRLAGPAPLAPASPAAGPASPRALAGRPARRPRPPARPAARRRAVAHGLDRHHCWGGRNRRIDTAHDAMLASETAPKGHDSDSPGQSEVALAAERRPGWTENENLSVERATSEKVRLSYGNIF